MIADCYSSRPFATFHHKIQLIYVTKSCNYLSHCITPKVKWHNSAHMMRFGCSIDVVFVIICLHINTP
jgi:hypothetical protein